MQQEHRLSAKPKASPSRLVSIRAYAKMRGLAPSTVSRQAANGTITLINNKVDPVLADRERSEGLSKRRGGKRAKRNSVAQSEPSTRSVLARTQENTTPTRTGMRPEVLALLGVMRVEWPQLIARLVRHFGGSAKAAVLAVGAVETIVEFTALAARGNPLADVADILVEPAPSLSWSPEQAALLTEIRFDAWLEDGATGEKLAGDIAAALDGARPLYAG
jgi:hypothetical protein